MWPRKKGLRPLSNPPAVAAAAIHYPYPMAPEATLRLAYLWAPTVVLHTSQACYLGLDRLRNNHNVASTYAYSRARRAAPQHRYSPQMRGQRDEAHTPRRLPIPA
jgi:hypothetical protein